MPAASPTTIQVVSRLKRILFRRFLEDSRLAGQRHELRDRMDTDFLRDRGPVHLDRALAHPERRRDLLVHETLDHLAQDLELPAREPRETLRARIRFRLTCAFEALPLER